jgi:hypothetical protein
MPVQRQVGNMLIEVPDELAKVPESELLAIVKAAKEFSASTESDQTPQTNASANIDLSSEDIDAQYRMELAGNELLRDPQEAAQREMEATVGTIASAPSRFASGVATELGSAVIGMVNPFAWFEAIKNAAGRMGSAFDETWQAVASLGRLDIRGAAEHARQADQHKLNAVFPVDDVVTRLRDQYNQGDVAGALGSAAGIVGSVFLPGPKQMARGALKAGGAVVGQTAAKRLVRDPGLWDELARKEVVGGLIPDKVAAARLQKVPSRDKAIDLMTDIVHEQPWYRNWTHGGPLDQAAKRLDEIRAEHAALEQQFANVPVSVPALIRSIDAYAKERLKTTFVERVRGPKGQMKGLRHVHSPVLREYAEAIQEYKRFWKQYMKATGKNTITIGELRAESEAIYNSLRSSRLSQAKEPRTFAPTENLNDMAYKDVRNGIKDVVYDAAPALRESDAAISAASSLVDVLRAIRQLPKDMDTPGVRAAGTMVGSHLPASHVGKRLVAGLSMLGAPGIFKVFSDSTRAYKLARRFQSMADAIRRGDTALAWADLHAVSALLRKNPTDLSRWTALQQVREQVSQEKRLEGQLDDQEDQE